MITLTAESRYEDVLPLLTSLARRGLLRLRAAGVHTVEHDDCLQQLASAWVVARRNWKPGGAPFAAYLARGAWQVFNRWSEEQIAFSANTPMSLDLADGDDSNSTIADFIPEQRDEDNEPDRVVERKDYREKLLSRLDPKAALFIRLIDSPPAELTAEFLKVRKRQEAGRQRGLDVPFSSFSVISMVSSLMGLSRNERTTMLRNAVEKVSKVTGRHVEL